MTATVCLDAGTTLVKAVVFDELGRELVVVRRPTVLTTPQRGWSEQDMTAVLDAVCVCLAEAVGRSHVPVGRVAITAQGDGAWMVDRGGQPVRSAALWNDARAHDIVDDWQRSGLLDRAFRLNGSLGNLGLPHAVMRWFDEHQPAALERAAHVLTCGSWLYGSFTGVWGLHRAEASAPWLAAATGEVSDALVSLYGLSAWRELVPRVLAGDDLTQPLTAHAAGRIGLAPGTPVTLAPYDVVATAAGGRSLSVGDGFCILGTTVCTGTLIAEPQLDGVPAGLTLLGDPGEPLIRAFPSLAGTGVLDWMTMTLGLSDVTALLHLAGESRAGANGVRLWPYLSPAGERAPFLDPQARGVLAGLALSSTPADLARAALEGLAQVVRDCVDAAPHPPHLLRLSGGGSGSDLWCQTIADVVGVPVERAAGSQVGAKGAQLYAEVAAGRYANLTEAAAALTDSPAQFLPQQQHRELFAERHQEFGSTRAALAEQWSGWRDEPST